MNLQLLGILTIVALLIGLNIYLRMGPRKRKGDNFNWQPDLSHKVMINELPPQSDFGVKQQRITLVEKSPEERAEERRSYLKENQNDKS
jgi:hypothetical protein